MNRPDLGKAQLRRQSYGIAMAQTTFGGPRGIWLECRKCPRSDVIAGSAGEEWVQVTDAEAATVFRRHGWTGEGDRMLGQLCPKCSEARKGTDGAG